MEIGTDEEGRSITYDQASHRFAIEGMVTGIDRLVAYDRSGHVRWVSDEFRDWVYEYDRVAREHANRPVSYSASKPAVADPGAAERQVDPLKPSRLQVVAALVVAGLLAACMLSFMNPIPPLLEDRAFREDLERSIQQEVGDDYTIEVRPSRFEREQSLSMLPERLRWVRKYVVLARSVSNPEFMVSMEFMYEQSDDGDSQGGRVRGESTEWARTLNQMPADRRASFESWLAARPDKQNLEALALTPRETVARMSLPAGVDSASVYSISWTPVMTSPVAVPMTSEDSAPGTAAGWDSGRRQWVEVGQP